MYVSSRLLRNLGGFFFAFSLPYLAPTWVYLKSCASQCCFFPFSPSGCTSNHKATAWAYFQKRTMLPRQSSPSFSCPFIPFWWKYESRRKQLLILTVFPCPLVVWIFLHFTSSGVPYHALWALSTACSRAMVVIDVPHGKKRCLGWQGGGMVCRGWDTFIVYRSRSQSIYTKRKAGTPCCENMWIDWVPTCGERLEGTDSCLGCMTTGLGAEVLELFLEAKNSRKVDVLSKIVQICG